MEKPGSRFLLANCVKNMCGRVKFEDAGHQTAFLLKMSLPQVFFTYFARKNQLPGFSISRTFA